MYVRRQQNKIPAVFVCIINTRFLIRALTPITLSFILTLLDIGEGEHLSQIIKRHFRNYFYTIRMFYCTHNDHLTVSTLSLV